ncbi:hypothetical protein LZ480_07645 [Solibacillus sp. MA9]|uniref:Transcriptional regulator n=1 Tax=Solibacillus palustris TaxID=2908203 RepID=A0ABS9UCA4_9BACL|nr:hypothetical protein [Solibacillus sp. MA9]MCH7321765.1 hypothetical protein [Solibacillus sp. MA9]
MAKQYTAVQVYEMVDRYYQMKTSLGLAVVSPYSVDQKNTMVQDYDNLGMPRAQGVGDPTARQALNPVHEMVLPERMVKDYEVKVAFIDEWEHVITKQRDRAVLHWRLSGLKPINIAELEGITDRHVRRILNDVAKKMSEMSAMSEMSKVS